MTDRHHLLICGLEVAIAQTKPNTLYRVKGSVSMEQAELMITLCEEILDLKKALSEKPKPKTIIRYKEKRR